MTMTDNKNGAPLEHYKSLFSVSEPEALSLRSGVKFESGAFRIRLDEGDRLLLSRQVKL